ncbi:hypothetical protein HY413_01140 [Candidatus Kaiserbacteria bacterium]|nr:hypothetical protein [Candidatus Kaiserbacteria bacterium]
MEMKQGAPTPSRKPMGGKLSLAMAALAGAMAAGNPAVAAPPDTTFEVQKTSEEIGLETELKNLLEKDPIAFIERAKQLGKKVPFVSLLRANIKAPLLVLNNLDHFELEASEEATVIRSMVESMDVVSAAQWLSTHPDKLERMRKNAEYWLENFRFDWQKEEYETIAHFPSPAAAQLMLAFYLKHGGKAVTWLNTTDHVEEFETATKLLEKYPFIAEHVNGADSHFDKSAFTKTARNLVNIEHVLMRTSRDMEAAIKARKEEGAGIADTTSLWANKFNAKNPLLLAKYAVLIARDIALRGVSADSAEEVQKSLVRIEAGQREAQKMDILKGRDLFVFMSGDSDMETKNDEKTRVHQLHDQNAANVYERIWKEKNPTGFKIEKLAVPFDEQGNVANADIKKTKRALLEYVEGGGNPRVVLIEAHGGRESIGIYKDPVKDTGEFGDGIITPTEFVAAHKKRVQDSTVAQNYATGKRDVYLFSQCLSSDFARNVFALLQKEKLPIPIIIASAEVGASAQFLPPSAHPGGRSEFTDALASRLEQGLDSVVEQALTFTPDGIDSPIIIFIPDAEGRPLQVTEPTNIKRDTDHA